MCGDLSAPAALAAGIQGGGNRPLSAVRLAGTILPSVVAVERLSDRWVEVATDNHVLVLHGDIHPLKVMTGEIVFPAMKPAGVDVE